MIDKKAIAKYHKRMDARLKKRGVSLDGIRRFDADWDENEHPRDKGGQFTSKNGGSAAKGEEKSKENTERGKEAKTESTPKPRGNTPKFTKTESADEFKKGFSTLRNGMNADKRWRVSDDYSVDDYKDMDKFMNENGSTFALHGTDIVSVAANAEKGDRGRDILADAVEAGGNKLDAYAGIYGFYSKCGFEPVSWTEWDDNYANDDWLEANGYTRKQWDSMKAKPKDEDLKVKREPIVFFKYTGKVNTMSLEDFKKSVEPLEYDKAYEMRDKSL